MSEGSDHWGSDSPGLGDCKRQALNLPLCFTSFGNGVGVPPQFLVCAFSEREAPGGDAVLGGNE